MKQDDFNTVNLYESAVQRHSAQVRIHLPTLQEAETMIQKRSEHRNHNLKQNRRPLVPVVKFSELEWGV